MLEQHVWTTFYTLRAFTPAMVKNGWGRVVVVSSPLAEEPAAGMSAYAAAKAAQQALIRSLAAELRGTGVTANLLYLCSDQAARINGACIPLFL